MYREKKNGETLRSRDTTAQHEINKNKKHFRGINFFYTWVRINGGAYLVKERSMVWLDSVRRWRYHVPYIPNNRG